MLHPHMWQELRFFDTMLRIALLPAQNVLNLDRYVIFFGCAGDIGNLTRPDLCDLYLRAFV